MFLLVPAHPGCPGQIPQSRKTVVCVCVCVCVCNNMEIHNLLRNQSHKKIKILQSNLYHITETKMNLWKDNSSSLKIPHQLFSNSTLTTLNLLVNSSNFGASSSESYSGCRHLRQHRRTSPICCMTQLHVLIAQQ